MGKKKNKGKNKKGKAPSEGQTNDAPQNDSQPVAQSMSVQASITETPQNSTLVDVDTGVGPSSKALGKPKVEDADPVVVPPSKAQGKRRFGRAITNKNLGLDLLQFSLWIEEKSCLLKKEVLSAYTDGTQNAPNYSLNESEESSRLADGFIARIRLLLWNMAPWRLKEYLEASLEEIRQELFRLYFHAVDTDLDQIRMFETSFKDMKSRIRKRLRQEVKSETAVAPATEIQPHHVEDWLESAIEQYRDYIQIHGELHADPDSDLSKTPVGGVFKEILDSLTLQEEEFKEMLSHLTDKGDLITRVNALKVHLRRLYDKDSELNKIVKRDVRGFRYSLPDTWFLIVGYPDWPVKGEEKDWLEKLEKFVAWKNRVSVQAEGEFAPGPSHTKQSDASSWFDVLRLEDLIPEDHDAQSGEEKRSDPPVTQDTVISEPNLSTDLQAHLDMLGALIQTRNLDAKTMRSIWEMIELAERTVTAGDSDADASSMERTEREGMDSKTIGPVEIEIPPSPPGKEASTEKSRAALGEQHAKVQESISAKRKASDPSGAPVAPGSPPYPVSKHSKLSLPSTPPLSSVQGSPLSPPQRTPKPTQSTVTKTGVTESTMEDDTVQLGGTSAQTLAIDSPPKDDVRPDSIDERMRSIVDLGKRMARIVETQYEGTVLQTEATPKSPDTLPMEQLVQNDASSQASGPVVLDKTWNGRQDDLEAEKAVDLSVETRTEANDESVAHELNLVPSQGEAQPSETLPEGVHDLDDLERTLPEEVVSTAENQPQSAHRHDPAIHKEQIPSAELPPGGSHELNPELPRNGIQGAHDPNSSLLEEEAKSTKTPSDLTQDQPLPIENIGSCQTASEGSLELDLPVPKEDASLKKAPERTHELDKERHEDRPRSSEIQSELVAASNNDGTPGTSQGPESTQPPLSRADISGETRSGGWFSSLFGGSGSATQAEARNSSPPDEAAQPWMWN